MSMTKTKHGMVDNRILPYMPIIEKFSKQFKVPVMVIVNTIYAESRGNVKAWNPSLGENSRGLMQISEKTAQDHPIKIPFMMLDTLFDAETNIFNGVKYLDYIRKYLEPSFKNIDEKTKWTVISSSYNQGMGYYKKALNYLNANQQEQTWENILHRVLNPAFGGRPWTKNANEYGPKIVGVLSPSQLKMTGISLAMVAGLGVGAYLLMGGKNGLLAN